MKKLTKTIFQIIMIILFVITIVSGMLFITADLQIEESKILLKVLGVSSIINIFLWLFYELKNAPQMENHE